MDIDEVARKAAEEIYNKGEAMKDAHNPSSFHREYLLSSELLDGLVTIFKRIEYPTIVEQLSSLPQLEDYLIRESTQDA